MASRRIFLRKAPQANILCLEEEVCVDTERKEGSRGKHVDQVGGA